MLSAGQCSREDLERLVDAARAYRDGRGTLHPSALIGLAFFEDSFRTRVGFDVAAARLKAHTTTVLGVKQSPVMGQPETALDAIKSVASWFDVLCVRHPDPSFAQQVADSVATPIINCGNGDDEHPTQALADLLAVSEIMGSIDGLRIAIVGDVEAMRTAHSLVLALARFDDVLVRCIAPRDLRLPGRFVDALARAGHTLENTTELAVSDVDVVYVAGLPKPTSAGDLSDHEQAAYRITPEVLGRLAPHARVFCPLPRIDEITSAVDSAPQAAYFEQSALAVWARMAVLDEALRAGPY